MIIENRKVQYNFFIINDAEAGLMLTGTEVKSLRNGKANITESYISCEGAELWLINAHIPEYLQANRFNHKPRRRRKLLMSRREIRLFSRSVSRDGMTIVPLKLYFNKSGLAKIRIALAKGKKNYDKREVEKKRDWNKEKLRLLHDR
ncbi:SsrA-binding protein SmpB [Candidatus Endowatersipora endosymbiont of Watersipora subatra]|uniref:SsrA-binding protein SmpB n=1 Tax=Candidatus Endowatersipora endosymbiont of Watersipora subatra TaxID=3077946 RepID=UPI00312CA01C